MNHLRLTAFVIATMLLAACGSDAAADGSTVAGPCDGVEAPGKLIVDGVNVVAVPDVAFCPQAVALATARLGWLHGPITLTAFRTSVCPPNARCALAMGGQGWVIFTFAFGDPVMVHVGLGETTAPGLGAGEPEPVPDWLLDEIRGIAGREA